MGKLGVTFYVLLIGWVAFLVSLSITDSPLLDAMVDWMEDTLEPPIEKVLGYETVTVDDLKMLAERGDVPYEFYRLALYKKLMNPDLEFMLRSSGEIRDSWKRPLYGRYIEKINDSWYRVVVIFPETLFTKKYVVVKVDLNIESRDEYVVDNWWPAYLKFIRVDKGVIKATKGNTTYANTIDVSYHKNTNPEDWRIADEIAEQILDFAMKNNLTRTQAAEIVYREFVPWAVRYYNNNDLIGMPYSFMALDGDSLVEVHVNSTDSLMEFFMLQGGGSCYGRVFTAVYVLNSMGMDAGLLGVVLSDACHALVAIPYDQVVLKELDGAPLVLPATIEVGGEHTQWVVYDIQGSLRTSDVLEYSSYIYDLNNSRPAYLINYLR